MAKPIGPTPEVEGEDAIEFIEWMENLLLKKIKNFGKKFILKEECRSNLLNPGINKMFFQGPMNYLI